MVVSKAIVDYVCPHPSLREMWIPVSEDLKKIGFYKGCYMKFKKYIERKEYTTGATVAVITIEQTWQSEKAQIDKR